MSDKITESKGLREAPYKKLLEYIDKNHPQLSELLDLTGINCRFNCNWHKDGITFIMPVDAVVKDLLKQAQKDTVGFENAATSLNSLIIRGCYLKADDFRDNVINMQYPAKLLPVKTKGKDILIDGIKAEFVTSFEAKSGEKSALWKIDSIPNHGSFPVAKAMPKRGNVKVGKYEPSNDQRKSNRFASMLLVEQAYVLHLLKQRSVGTSDLNPFIEAVVSLLCHIKKDDEDLYRQLLSIVMLDNFDFYALVDPHGDLDNPLVDNQYIDKWVKGEKLSQSTIHNMLKQIRADQAANSVGGKLIFPQKTELLKVLKQKRTEFTVRSFNSLQKTMAELESIYSTLEKTNKVGGVEFWPEGRVTEYFKNDKHTGMKLLHDDVRYLSCLRFKKLECDPRPIDFGEINALFNFIGDALHANTAAERGTQRGLLNVNRIKYLIAPTMELSEIIAFINSTGFLALPLCKNEVPKCVDEKPQPGNIAYFNVHANIYKAYDHLSTSEFDYLTDSIKVMSKEDKQKLAKLLAA